jgi:hypothetical protein
MAIPHSPSYTDDSGCPRVCAVDDAWFEGGVPLVEYFGLGGIHRRSGKTLILLRQ